MVTVVKAVLLGEEVNPGATVMMVMEAAVCRWVPIAGSAIAGEADVAINADVVTQAVWTRTNGVRNAAMSTRYIDGH